MIRAVSPEMLPTTAAFHVLGVALGIGSGLKAVALRRRERQLARLAAELGAGVRELVRAGEGPRLELKSSARRDYRKGAGNREEAAEAVRHVSGG